MKLNFIDLFSGAGGLSCGLEMSGHRCLLGVDADKDAMKTFALNHPNAQAFCGDIRVLNKKKIQELIGNKKVDMVVGGPPCQGFSTVGKGDPKDQRNSLFLHFVRIVALLKPKFVIMENVTGLLALKNKQTVLNIINQFKKIGINLDVQIMASEKYGVPERRRRTIFLGCRKSFQCSFPPMTHCVSEGDSTVPPVTIGEILTDLKDENGKTFNHDLSKASLKNKIDLERIKKIPEGKSIRYEQDEKKYLSPRLRLKIQWEKLPEKRLRQAKYFRLDSKLPSPTILTQRCMYYHPVKNRYLTQREAAKIQSFPNDFVFTGSLTSQWRQIGNAVPPKLGYALGRHLLRIIKKSKMKRKSEEEKSFHIKQKISTLRKKVFIYK